jgi:hypothetical protein
MRGKLIFFLFWKELKLTYRKTTIFVVSFLYLFVIHKLLGSVWNFNGVGALVQSNSCAMFSVLNLIFGFLGLCSNFIMGF